MKLFPCNNANPLVSGQAIDSAQFSGLSTAYIRPNPFLAWFEVNLEFDAALFEQFYN